VTVLELAETIVKVAGAGSQIVYEPRPEDDPERRRPDISLATSALGWEPAVDLASGLERTLAWARKNWS
jgi:nucleoside-diphosphate-sugar epimerase